MECDREGSFRGEAVSYGLWNPGGKKSTAISMTIRVTEFFNHESKEWENWREYEMDVEGDVWIIGKEGKLIENNVKSICEHLGWNGDLVSINDRSWEPKPFGFTTQADEYNGRVRYKLNFINSFDFSPSGGAKTIEPDMAKSLNQQYGAQLRALAGSASKPKAPSSPPPKPAQRETVVPGASNSNRAAMAAANAVDDSSIPF